MSEEPAVPQSVNLRSLMLGIGLLGALLLLTSVVTSVFVSQSHGVLGIYASLSAFAVCWISGSLALTITALTAGGIQAVSGMFGSIAVRTGVPLCFGVLASLVGGPLVEAGLFGLLLIHYLVGLLCETVIAVVTISKPKLGAPAS